MVIRKKTRIWGAMSAQVSVQATDLVVCFEHNASFHAQAVSRFLQQMEPTWESVWGSKEERHSGGKEGRHMRKVQLSSKEADNSELGIHLHPRVLAILLLW